MFMTVCTRTVTEWVDS